jgi:regulator of protease activity HflC (stomatin/prohibitin superfamily)
MNPMFVFFIILVIIAVIATVTWLISRRHHAAAVMDHLEKRDAVRQKNRENNEAGRGWANDQEPDEPSAATRVVSFWTMIGAWAFALVIFFFGSFYTQGAGESVLQKDVTGNVVGSTTSTGLHLKFPWVDTTTYNIRQQPIKFAGKDNGKDTDDSGKPRDDSQITVQDKDGVTDNIDVTLRYSIRPNSVEAIFKQFGSEENFKSTFIESDIRSATRNAPNKFHTLELLTNRVAVTREIQRDLEERWSKFGVTIDSVSLQDVRPPKSVQDSYAAAQKAQVKVSQAKAELEAAKVSAQQAVVQADAQAKANATLNASLTPQILQQQYLDTLRAIGDKGNLVVVPEGGAAPLINVGK